MNKDKCESVNCPSNKVCNPKSGKCVLKTGKIGREIMALRRSSKASVMKDLIKFPENLPPDMLMKIISFAPHTCMCKVNKELKDVCTNDSFCKQRIEAEFPLYTPPTNPSKSWSQIYHSMINDPIIEQIRYGRTKLKGAILSGADLDTNTDDLIVDCQTYISVRSFHLR